MIDTAVFKQTLKDASDEEAKALYIWATACMEVRGLIDIAGAPATRKRRSDAGKARDAKLDEAATKLKIDELRERLQPSLSGLPDESAVGE